MSNQSPSLLSAEELDYALIEAIPLHRTLGMRVVHDQHPPAVMLPESGELANHVGANAGAAVFAVAEAASAAMVWSYYAPLAERHFALPAEAHLRFRRPAVGTLLGRAVPGPPLTELQRLLAESEEITLPVEVAVHGEDGRVVLELTVLWTFRPARHGSLSTLPRRSR
jgi:acyl-coenzyme A thioesterase PaaI-like protein